MATRAPAPGLNTVFNRRERLNGGKVSGTVSFVWAIIGQKFVLASRLVKESITVYVTDSVTDAQVHGWAFRWDRLWKHGLSFGPQNVASSHPGPISHSHLPKDHRLIASRASS